MAGVTGNLVKVVGTLFLIFVQFLIYFVDKKFSSACENKEVPMNKKHMVFSELTKATFSFIFNLGTNLLANFCLQTQYYYIPSLTI